MGVREEDRRLVRVEAVPGRGEGRGPGSRSDGRSPGIWTSVDFGAPPRGDYVLKFRAKAERGGRAEVSWAPGRNGRLEDWRKAAMEIEPGEGREYAVEFPGEGGMLGLRIEIPGDAGPVAFDWIRLSHAERTGPSESALALSFDCRGSTPLTFDVKDEAGKDTFAAFVIEDGRGRIYPSQAKRAGAGLLLPAAGLPDDGRDGAAARRDLHRPLLARPGVDPGDEDGRGRKGEPVTLSYQVQRWVDPYAKGWVSGDHHIHAAGCAHYENPTEGVHAEDMIRHCLGEDLKVGCNLTWGPCFDYQKQFFTGKDDEVSRYPYLLRYDVEVSGFGSHQSGHLCLLRLKEQIYPGRRLEAPLADARPEHAALGEEAGGGVRPGPLGDRADALRGPCGRGKDGPNGLPNYSIPPYDGIGANEYIVDVTHEVPGPDGKPVPAVDFISTMDTDRKAELNMWYHTLNCGFRVRASGETDFPCISGERVGMGRVYVKVDGKLDYDRWCEGHPRRAQLRQRRHEPPDGLPPGGGRASRRGGRTGERAETR